MLFYCSRLLRSVIWTELSGAGPSRQVALAGLPHSAACWHLGSAARLTIRLCHITRDWVLDISWRNGVLFLQSILFTLCHLPGLSLQVVSLSTWTAFISFHGVSREKKYESRNFQDSWELGSEIAQYNSGTFYWSKQTEKKNNPSLSPVVGNWTPSLDRRRDNALWQMGTWNQRSSLWKNYAIQRPKLHNHQETKVCFCLRLEDKTQVSWCWLPSCDVSREPAWERSQRRAGRSPDNSI